jgi:cell division ATPase FtsA
MINLPFLNKKSSQDIIKFLTLDIESDAVRALAFYSENNSFKIIGTGKKILNQGTVRGGIIVETAEVIEAVKSAVAEASQDSEEEITDVILGINGAYALN